MYWQRRYTSLFDKGVSYVNLAKGAITGEDPVYIGYSEVAIKQGKYPFHFKFRKTFDNILYQLKKEGKVDRIIKEAFNKIEVVID